MMLSFLVDEGELGALAVVKLIGLVVDALNKFFNVGKFLLRLFNHCSTLS
jgi:hypothetical protein